jgi:hypothetical protein
MVIHTITGGWDTMAKGIGKREYHKRDMDKLNRTALIIGSVAAAVMLCIVVVSLLLK